MAMWRILQFCISIFNSLKDASVNLIDWMDTMTIMGDTYGELLFGAGLWFLLGWAAAKFILDIWPG